MKNKKILLYHIILLLLSSLTTNAQHTFCDTGSFSNNSATSPVQSRQTHLDCDQSANYAPDEIYPEHRPITTIYLNFHFMQKNDGSGNFNATDDGDPQNPDTWHTGYQVAELILNQANQKLANNQQMNLFLGNTPPPALQTQFRYELYTDPNDPNDTGVYFHQSTVDYFYCLNGSCNACTKKNQFSIHRDRVIDIFFLEQNVTNPTNGGHTYTICNNTPGHAVALASLWAYHTDNNSNTGWWDFSGLLNHEIGHILLQAGNSSGHSFASPTCGGIDINVSAENNGGDEWNSGSNNVMGYNQVQDAITPCQLGIMHQNLTTRNWTFVKEDFCDIDQNTPPLLVDAPNTTIVWNSARNMKSDIRITPLTTLEIRCEIGMPKDAKIIVERGATLIVNEGIITSACEDSWTGIEVWGNPNRAHPTVLSDIIGGNYPNDINDHGVVLIQNNSIIENARNAIATKKDGSTNFFGGIVYAENSLFGNNRRSIEFLQFPPPSSNLSDNNISQVINCNFENFQNINDVEASITLWDVHNIIIDNCTFFDNFANIDTRGIGSVDADFEVINSTFSNLDIAITTNATAALVSTPIIGQSGSPNTFEDNGVGILDNGSTNITIVDNEFDNSSLNNSNIGVYLQNSINYNIEGNTFTNCFEGVIANNTGTPDKLGINRNAFNATEGAITALDNNTGLKLNCNDINDANFDITIEPTSTSTNSCSINPLQANVTNLNDINDETDPASNKFSIVNSNTTTHFFIDPSTEPFTYVHHNPSVEARYLPTVIDDTGNKLELEQANALFCNTNCFPSDATDFDCVEGGCPGGVDDCGVCNSGGKLYGACDCDGTSPENWWPDNDGDGLGNSHYTPPYYGCTPPDGWVNNNEDTFDNCAGTFDECNYCSSWGNPPDCPGCTYKKAWYLDSDGDGLGNPNEVKKACTQPPGYVSNSCDKDDSAGICETYCNNRNARWANRAYECPLYAAPNCRKCALTTAVPYYDNWNGGLNPDLITSISIAPTSPKTWNKLTDAAPYLADEVLIAAVNQLKMPVTKLQRLLVMHTPLSNEVTTAIKKRSQPLPQGIIRAIEQASKGQNLSERQKLGLQIAELEYNAGLWLNAAIKLHLLEGNIDAAIKLLAQDKKPSSQRRQVELLLQKGDYKQASKVLEQLPDDEDNNYYQQLQEINIDLQANKGSYESLTKYQLHTLRQIAQSHSTSSGYARSILRIATGEQFPLSMPKRKRRTIRKQEETAITPIQKGLNIFPNPAQSMVHLSWHDLENSPIVVAIYDLTGRLVETYPLEPQQRQLNITTERLHNGIYMTTLLDKEGRILKKAKLAILK